jgi:hypothetical protein
MATSRYTRMGGPFGTTLHYYHPGPDWRHLGEPLAWTVPLGQIRRALPAEVAAGLLEGLDIHIYDADCDVLDEEVARAQTNLQDLNPKTPEEEGGDGLYWDRDKLQLMVRHDDQTAGRKPSRIPIAAHNVQHAMDCLSHELGHHAAWCMAFGRADAPYIAKELTRLLMPYLQAYVPGQCSNVHEALAEIWRACNGCDRTRHTFSDGRRASVPIEARHLITLGPAVYARLQRKLFERLNVDPQGITWEERGFVTRFFLGLPWFPYQSWEVTGRYRLDPDGVLARI